MQEQSTNKFPTLREVQEMEKSHEDFRETLQEHIFSPPKPYVEEEGIKQTTRFDRENTMLAKARMESTIGAL